METVIKSNITTLMLAVFMLAGNCLAEKPIANYCLYIESMDEYFLKFESIIDSSVFAKMEERNCRWCDSKELLSKKYFIKIESRDNMTCSGEYVLKKYNFLFRNFSLGTLGYDTRSFGIMGGHVDCFDPSFGGMKWVPCHSSSSEGNSSSSSIVRRPYLQGEALTEIPIDFPRRTAEVIQDASVFNEVTSSIGETIPVSWEFKVVCPPHRDTTLTGSYLIRIARECKEEDFKK